MKTLCLSTLQSIHCCRLLRNLLTCFCNFVAFTLCDCLTVMEFITYLNSREMVKVYEENKIYFCILQTALCVYILPTIPAHLSISLTPVSYQWQSLHLFPFPPLMTLQHREEICTGFQELLSALLSVMSCRVTAEVRGTRVFVLLMMGCMFERVSLLCMRCDVWWVMRKQMVHTAGFGDTSIPT